MVTMSDPHAHGRSFSTFDWIKIAGGVVLFVVLFVHHLKMGHTTHAAGHAPPAWGLGVLPFAGLLGAIALFPLLPRVHQWWESNRSRLNASLFAAAATLVYVLLAEGWHQIPIVLDHAFMEYVPFMVLLFSLYVISGGINLRGDLAAHPGTNTAFLAIGAAIASFIGTTGASMVLIRPLLQTNSERKHVVHTVVFFIFLVSNIGGTLLPIGDPPLFLGFIRGVDFFWTLGLWSEWAIVCVLLLIVYFIIDTMAYKRETPSDVKRDDTQLEPLRLSGVINLLWLAGVVAAVAFLTPGKEVFGLHIPVFLREAIMLCFVGISLVTTPNGVRAANRFNYHAIMEVAALFLGIFVAMQVPLMVLNVYGAELGLTTPAQFFWATGSLSAFLDNAPTYVVFFETARTLGPDVPTTVIAPHLLVGISLGAVFMGAMTYIGNGPNFMVKAIAEQSGVRMPTFFGFMFKYSLPILVPAFLLVTFLLPGTPPPEPDPDPVAPAADVTVPGDTMEQITAGPLLLESPA
jgi:Na+/H+ antiporter NhaD/arsenite permease-like protein